MSTYAEDRLSDYIDVAERIRAFHADYPEGTLQSYIPPYLVETPSGTFVVYAAAAYRTPADERPGIGWAWEPVPGPTKYTRNSELQNAETAAWGRAIVALGFATTKIASAEEVRNRSAKRDVEPAAKPAAAEPDPGAGPPVPMAQLVVLQQAVEMAAKSKPVWAEAKVVARARKLWGDEITSLSMLTQTQAAAILASAVEALATVDPRTEEIEAFLENLPEGYASAPAAAA